MSDTTEGGRTMSDTAAPRWYERAAATSYAPYQTAVLRVGLAAVWLVYLLRHWPDRAAIYGPDAAWSRAMAERGVPPEKGFSALLWWDGQAYFEVFYLLAVAAAVALLLGWRTRASSVVFVLCMLSFQHRNDYVTTAGDRLLHILALYLLFARCAQVWSLDARRAARRAAGDRDTTGILLWALLGALFAPLALAGLFSAGWIALLGGLWAAQGLWWWAARARGEDGAAREVCDRIAHLVHNGALFVIGAQICLVYASAGWYKIQGTTWQNGSAVYYAMHLEFLTPWPALSHALSGNALLSLVMTYGTVAIQVAFPFALMRRKVKNVLLVLMIGEHIGIWVLMGLPYFSMVMIAADAVFAPTVLLLWLDRRCGALWDRVRPGRRPEGKPAIPDQTGAPAPVP
ncbi:HTTM domain-containing protein [Streptomyces sp. NPDC093600]|uniref:HTTM domain-containing protein n=1 Tax=Streptomyces sp. NPDC093600 TaxID=3366047 RepID=UPI0038179BA5